MAGVKRGRAARGPDDPGPADVADVARRLAVLMQAGISPRAAWEYLASSGSVAAAAVMTTVAGGASIPQAIAAQGAAWHDLAAAWSVATEVGAALAEALRAFAAGLGDAAEALDDVAVALAEPAGTARLMLWLPGAGIALGALLGFDTFGILFSDARGLACLVLGVALVLAARAWTARLVRAARPVPGLPGLDAELFAIALSGGASIDRAATHVARARRLGRAASADDALDVPRAAPIPVELQGILDLSRSAGVPAVELLRAESAWARHRARVEGRTRAARLGTRLLLPLGVCTLPSFLLLAVAPLLLAVLSSADVPLI